MRIVLSAIGAAAVVGGLVLLVTTAISKAELAPGLCTGIALVLAGIVHFIAAATNYRGHWSFVIGVALLVIGFLGLGCEIDDALAGQANDVWLKILLVCMFSSFGALSLWSGHKLHRCSLELERISRVV